MKKFNITCKFVEEHDPEEIQEDIDDKTRACYLETVENPQVNVADIANGIEMENVDFSKRDLAASA